MLERLLPCAAIAGLAFACSSNPQAVAGSGPTSSTTQQDACPSGTDAASGKTYVSARGCPTCHNADLAGSTSPLTSTQVGTALPSDVRLYAPNLTPDMTTGLGSWSDTDIKFAIIHGIDNTGADLCPQMQHYVGMCDAEASGIVAYLRSLPSVSKTIPGSICPPYKR